MCFTPPLQKKKKKKIKKQLFHSSQHRLVFYLSPCSKLITQLSDCVCVWLCVCVSVCENVQSWCCHAVWGWAVIGAERWQLTLSAAIGHSGWDAIQNTFTPHNTHAHTHTHTHTHTQSHPVSCWVRSYSVICGGEIVRESFSRRPDPPLLVWKVTQPDIKWARPGPFDTTIC